MLSLPKPIITYETRYKYKEALIKYRTTKSETHMVGSD